MKIVDLIVALAAFWGAALSTFVVIRDARHQKPRIRVRVFYQLSLGMNHRFEIKAENTGSRPIMLNKMARLNLLNGYVLYSPYLLPDDSTRCCLQPGTSCSYSIDHTLLAKGFKEAGYNGKVKYRASVTDELGSEYLGKRSEFNISEHLTQDD